VGNELAVCLREAHLQYKTVRSAESGCGFLKIGKNLVFS
jgi:hypothetical protein